jgi:hypothetical protein
MLFANRDVMFPDNNAWETLCFANSIAPEHFDAMINMYTGENEEEVSAFPVSPSPLTSSSLPTTALSCFALGS